MQIQPFNLPTNPNIFQNPVTSVTNEALRPPSQNEPQNSQLSQAPEGDTWASKTTA